MTHKARWIVTIGSLVMLADMLPLPAYRSKAQVVESRLAPALARQIDGLFAAFDQPNAPGCELGVYRRGSTLYEHGYGLANLEHRQPWSAGVVTQVRSMSKQFTAMAVFLLAADGRVSLDDPVTRYVPELPNYDPSRPITIRYLLYQMSGLRDYRSAMELRGIDNERHYTVPEAMALLTRQRGLNFPPGEEFGYSNSNYFLLALVVERVSGESLRAFTEHRIFEPLGMRHTHFHDDLDEVVLGRAQGYTPAPDGSFRISEDHSVSVGPGGLYTTLADLARWDRNFIEGTVGGQAVLRDMQTPGVFSNGRNSDYAAGLWVSTYRGLRAVRHDGGGAGYRTEMLRLPDQGVSVFVLCNTTTASPVSLAAGVADVVVGDAFLNKAESHTADHPNERYVPLAPGTLRQFTGLYGGDADRTLFEVALENEKLTLVLDNEAGFDLGALGDRRFRVQAFPNGATTVQFTTGGDGQPTSMLFDLAGLPKPLTIAARPRPSREALSAYAGRYYSAELDVTYTIAVDQEGLVVRLAGLVDRPLFGPMRHWRDETFVGLGKTLVFEPRSDGPVNGFVLNWSRVQGVRFERVPR